MLRSINLEFGPPPVPALGVVPDLVISLVSEPVGQRPVLPLRLGEPLLHQQRLVGSHYGVLIPNIILNIKYIAFIHSNHSKYVLSESFISRSIVLRMLP